MHESKQGKRKPKGENRNAQTRTSRKSRDGRPRSEHTTTALRRAANSLPQRTPISAVKAYQRVGKSTGGFKGTAV